MNRERRIRDWEKGRGSRKYSVGKEEAGKKKSTQAMAKKKQP